MEFKRYLNNADIITMVNSVLNGNPYYEYIERTLSYPRRQDRMYIGVKKSILNLIYSDFQIIADIREENENKLEVRHIVLMTDLEDEKDITWFIRYSKYRRVYDSVYNEDKLEDYTVIVWRSVV